MSIRKAGKGGSLRSGRAWIAAIALGSYAAMGLLAMAPPAQSEESAVTSLLSASAQAVRLRGHVHQLAQPRFDRGNAPDSLAMHSLQLVLAKSAAQKQALAKLLAAQQDPYSPQYHHWLSPSEYGARFGASEATVSALTQWLEENGFKVDAPPASRARLTFHGSKAQVEAAFHIEIHRFEVDGEKHFANISNPEVPSTVDAAITAIQGLHDFYPKSSLKIRRPQATPQTTYDAGQSNLVGPTDFASMYNLLPLYTSGVTGAGVTIGIVGRSDIDPRQASAFWSRFGITRPQLTSIPVPNGQDPGQANNDDSMEAYLDVEVAGALAPGAKILLVRDANIMLAAQYVIDQNLAGILNVSFGLCESALGADNSPISSLWQQAVAQGITVIVSAGDSGAAACAKAFTPNALSTSGVAVNGLASTPYNLAVGGTNFDPTQSGNWATGNAPGTLATAQGHIPEMVWNDSCANPQIAQAVGTDSGTLCNTATLNGRPNPFLLVAGGGGGLSSCVSISNNTCQGGYVQPAWQRGVAGTQGLRTRAIPDVSVVASNWIICSYDNMPCDPTTQSGHDVVMGTSAAAPAVAAILALLDQQLSTSVTPDGRQGLINTQLYRLAAAEYGSPQAPNAGASTCSASLGTNIGSGCVFYNVTAGANSMPCRVAGYDGSSSLPVSTCVAPAGAANGIMEIGSAPSYMAGTGFNLATGLGSINAANLVAALANPAAPPAPSAPAAPTGLTAAAGNGTVALTWATSTGASTYNLYVGTSPGAEGGQPVQTGLTTASITVSGLSNGTTYYFKVAAVNAGGASALSAEAQGTPTTPSLPPSPTPPSKGGGGAIDPLGLGALALLLALRRRGASPLRRLG
jgi:subtilase family serine protease